MEKEAELLKNGIIKFDHDVRRKDVSIECVKKGVNRAIWKPCQNNGCGNTLYAAYDNGVVICLECKNKAARRYKKNNPEKVVASKKKWAAENRDYLRVYCRARAEKLREQNNSE